MIQNKNKNFSVSKILVFTLIISFVIANFFVVPIFAQEEGSEETVGDAPPDLSSEALAQEEKTTAEVAAENQKKNDEENLIRLNQGVSKKRDELNTLQKEIEAYQEQIETKQSESRGLNNQIGILDNQVAKINLDIEATQLKIEQTQLEIQSLNIQIQRLEDKIGNHKNKIGEYIRLIYQNDQVSYLEILLKNNAFSDFYDQIKYTEEISSDLKSSLDKLKNNKSDLEVQRGNLEDKAEQENELKDELQKHKDELGERTLAQEILFIQSKLTERQYKNFQYQLQLEQQQINSDIVTLEKELRKQLEDREIKERFRGFGPARLSWPISPARGITAYFHDPDYPFRYIFEHPAIDIRAFQGTPITVAESGFVGRVKFDGSTRYGYIMIIHNDGLSTVYGHISAVYISENGFVTKGQTIGLTGGTPGSPGAGNLSTGPHLHFETRLNGIPVNPLEYLP